MTVTVKMKTTKMIMRRYLNQDMGMMITAARMTDVKATEIMTMAAAAVETVAVGVQVAKMGADGDVEGEGIDTTQAKTADIRSEGGITATMKRGRPQSAVNG